jgi:hypothetical protein
MSPTQAHHVLGKLCRAEPFKTFVIHTTGGRQYEVEAPERLALPENPDAGTVIVYVGKEFHIIGLDAVESLEVVR